MTMSQFKIISTPPPCAMPFTAAMIGFDEMWRLLIEPKPWGLDATPSCSLDTPSWWSWFHLCNVTKWVRNHSGGRNCRSGMHRSQKHIRFEISAGTERATCACNYHNPTHPRSQTKSKALRNRSSLSGNRSVLTIVRALRQTNLARREDRDPTVGS